MYASSPGDNIEADQELVVLANGMPNHKEKNKMPCKDAMTNTELSKQPTVRRQRRRLHLGYRCVARSFAAYCHETSLHGWKYVSSSDSSLCEKVSWLFLLLCSLSTASVLVYRAINDFLSYTVSTNMDSLSTSFDNLYFPAITICNMNSIQRSVLMKYGIQNDYTMIDVFDRMINTGSAVNFTEDELKMFDDIERIANGSSRLKTEGQPKCHNMFLTYSWRNEKINFSGGEVTMHYGQTTDKSVCCQIFPGMLSAENNHVFDINNASFWNDEPNPWEFIFDGYKKGIKPGKQGVKVLIDIEAFEYFSVHSQGSEGVLVLIQHYRDIPLMRKESFVLGPGFEADVGLSITEITTSSGAITRFSPEERDCYTHDEVNLVALPLKKGYRMSMKNCLFDKALHATKEECGCRPPFYVLGALGPNLTTCRGTQLHCAYKIFDDVVQYRRVGTAKTCRAPCNDQLYDSRITFAHYPNAMIFTKRPEVCPLMVKVIKICTEWLDPEAIGEYGQYEDEYKIKKPVLLAEYPTLCENIAAYNLNQTCEEMQKQLNQDEALGKDLYSYAKRNLLWLNVYIKDSFATRIVRDERMTRTSFVANVGGLLGLCMGFSLVSVAEIIYFSCKRHSRPRKSKSESKFETDYHQQSYEISPVVVNHQRSSGSQTNERDDHHERLVNGKRHHHHDRQKQQRPWRKFRREPVNSHPDPELELQQRPLSHSDVTIL